MNYYRIMRGLRFLSCLALVAVIASSCATTPLKLDSSTNETGLVLFHGELRGKNILQVLHYRLNWASVVSLKTPEDPIKRLSFSKGLVVFDGLPPGTYSLVQVSGYIQIGMGTQYITLPVPPIPVNMFEVRAGEPIYFGKIIYRDQKRFGSEWVREVDDNPSLEIKAWQKVIDACKDSLWIPLIQKRMRTVEAGLPNRE